MWRPFAFRLVCLGWLIVVPNLSQAFEYDAWKSGITMHEALKIAETNDIPLTCAELGQPLQRGQDHFRPGVVKRSEKSQNLCYKQSLMGTMAIVTLHFTPISRKLSNIHIYWDDTDITHQKEILLALAEKYGEPLKNNPTKDQLPLTPQIRIEIPLSETQFFAPDEHNRISVQLIEKRKRALILIYNDLTITRQEQTEEKIFQQYFKTRYRQQHKNRM